MRKSHPAFGRRYVQAQSLINAYHFVHDLGINIARLLVVSIINFIDYFFTAGTCYPQTDNLFIA